MFWGNDTIFYMQEPKYDLKKIIIAGIIIVIIAGLIGFLIIRKKNQSTTDVATPTDLFPYGTTTVGTDDQNGAGTPIGDINPATGAPAGGLVTMSSAAKLRQITNYPVTNMVATLVNKTISEPKLDEKTGKTIFISGIMPTDMVRWNVKQTGVLMDAEVSDQSIVQSQTSQTQIPGAEELWFANSGNTAVYRVFDDVSRIITSYRGTLPTAQTLGYCTTTFTETIGQGARSNQAKELQNYLNHKLNGSLTVDGAFGAKSVAALKQVQTLFQLPGSGKTDVDTLTVINNDCADIKTAFDKIQSEPKKLTGSFMFSNIVRGTVSPDGSKMFYLMADQTNGAIGTIINADGTGVKKIFNSPFTEWMPQWVNSATIAMTTLASREADGYLYYLDTTTGAFKKILGPARGLTTLVSPDAKTVIYSNSNDSDFATRIYYTNNGTAKTLDLDTLPAKCVWQDTVTVICGVPQSVPNTQYPDAWYQGIVSFGDSIWSINTVTGATSTIITPEQKIDAVKLQMSPDKKYLYFINRNDESLWSLKLN